MHNNSAAYLKKTWRQHGDYKPIPTFEFKFKNMAIKGLPTELSPSFKKIKPNSRFFWRQSGDKQHPSPCVKIKKNIVFLGDEMPTRQPVAM